MPAMAYTVLLLLLLVITMMMMMMMMTNNSHKLLFDHQTCMHAYKHLHIVMFIGPCIVTAEE